MKAFAKSLLVLLPLGLAACGDDSSDNSSLKAVSDEATVVLHDFSAFGGLNFTFKAVPGGNGSATKTIGMPEIEGAGLRNKISSAKITCGSRASQVLFSDSANDWGNRILLQCNPGESKSIDFTRVSSKSGKFISDRVAWASVLAHTTKHQSFDFSGMVTKYVDMSIKSRLPAKVSVARTSQTNWIDSKSFEIKQELNIADAPCSGKKVYVSYKLNLSTPGSGAGVKTNWTTTSHQAVFADQSCEAKYKSILADSLGKNAAFLQSEMNKSGQSPKSTYYLTPSDLSDRILASWGNL